MLSAGARLVLDGASVAGDPFEPDLAASAAGISEAAAIEALDELLRCDLVRITDVPRRFRFRHPIALFAGQLAAMVLITFAANRSRPSGVGCTSHTPGAVTIKRPAAHENPPAAVPAHASRPEAMRAPFAFAAATIGLFNSAVPEVSW